MKANHRITINLTDEEYHAITAVAERFRVSMAWLGRHALSEAVEKYKNTGQLAMPFDSVSDKENS